MNTQPITIENGRVTIRSNANGVWLTQSQIADLFDVFTSAVSANIRAILKSGVLQEDRVFRRTRSRNGNLVERNDYGTGISAQIRKCRDISQMDYRAGDNARNHLENTDNRRSNIELK